MTNQLKVSVRAKITEMFNRLNLKTEEETILSLGKIHRITKQRANAELHIKAFCVKICRIDWILIAAIGNGGHHDDADLWMKRRSLWRAPPHERNISAAM